MKILVLGGTRFVGRAIVEDALDRGHEVALVHRGQTGDSLFAGRAETIHADRLVSLDALKDRTWDACIDTCAYFPRAIRLAADVLKGNVGQYSFISTISVYKEMAAGGVESSPVFEEGDPENEVINAESYGFLKVLCEREVVEQFGEGSHIVRPGIVVGPNDHTDRFTYWPWRIATESRVLVPANSGHFAQWIDARDLAAFTILGVERGLSGPYHAVGHAMPLNQMLDAIRLTVNPACELVRVDLDALGIQPWVDLPMVTPPGDGSFQLNPAKALEAGLSPRPLVETVNDVLTWFKEQGREPVAGMPKDRHSELLAAVP